jgi:hypothetical protein
MDPSLTDQSKQETRTFLRERYLRLMAAINDQNADINMYGKTKVTGTLKAMDINVQSLQISNLQTPIGVIPDATLRLGDIRTISISELKQN